MFEKRIHQLQESLGEHEIDALLVTSTYNIAYLTGIRAFSIEEREARILVTKQNIYLFTDARYTGMVKGLSFLKLCEISASNTFLKQLGETVKKIGIKSLGFEEDNITYKETSDLEEKINVDYVPTEGIIDNLRTIKDEREIEKVRKACLLTDKAYDFILKQIKPGMTELEVKFVLENYILSEGGQLSFESIVAFGPNSAIPHHLSSNSKLQTSDIILLDFGAKVEGYCSDMTRTVFFGQPSEKQTKMYNAVLEAQEIGIDYIKTHSDETFELKKAHELANSHLHTLYFPDIPHSLGHGVGLQVHENPVLSPYSDEKLETGMVVTVEPGVYVADTGGIRIEDTVLVTKNGIELLTKSSKKLTVIA